MNPRFAIVSGPQSGSVVPLPPGEFVVGRDEAADLSFSDDALSRRHCMVTFEEGEYRLQDCGSTNGTTLNGDRLHGKRALRHGDRIGIGDTALVFLTEAEAGSAEPPVYFDDTPLDSTESAVSARSNILLTTLVDFSNTLRNTRDARAIREKLLYFIFEISPADRAAILLLDREGLQFETLAGRDRRDAARSIRVSRTIAERIYKDGGAILSNNLSASGLDHIESLRAAKVHSVVCVPMEAFDRRVGVIYADASHAESRFDTTHLELLTVVGTTAAIAFEYADHLERLETENSRLQHDLGIRYELVGNSPAMAEQAGFIARTAPMNSTVLIQGESGTGKELLARALHRNSKRSDRPFLAVNCAALAENLAESELFGYEKGAFTGAEALRKGIFEVAEGGTLFLDEVGELRPAVQAKLLRALQEREIQRLGGARPVKVDIRIIAATNRDLRSAVAAGEFRQDLYFRLNVIAVTTPPLRERREDIPLLARHFIARYCQEIGRPVPGISMTAERMLVAYDWPGNVRELQNVIERAVVLGSTAVVLPEDLPAELLETATSQPESPLPHFHEAVNALKCDLLEKAFAQAGGNAKKASAILGFESNPRYVYRLLKNLGLTQLLKRE